MDVNEAHARRLKTLLEQGFEFGTYPLFEGHIAVKKYGCAALLKPVSNDRLEISAQPGYLVEGNIAVKIQQGGEEWFVWKSHRLPATPERQQQLRRFEEELRRILEE